MSVIFRFIFALLIIAGSTTGLAVEKPASAAPADKTIHDPIVGRWLWNSGDVWQLDATGEAKKINSTGTAASGRWKIVTPNATPLKYEVTMLVTGSGLKTFEVFFTTGSAGSESLVIHRENVQDWVAKRTVPSETEVKNAKEPVVGRWLWNSGDLWQLDATGEARKINPTGPHEYGQWKLVSAETTPMKYEVNFSEGRRVWEVFYTNKPEKLAIRRKGASDYVAKRAKVD